MPNLFLPKKKKSQTKYSKTLLDNKLGEIELTFKIID
mgnify:CR=1 FL=1